MWPQFVQGCWLLLTEHRKMLLVGHRLWLFQGREEMDQFG